MGLTGEHRAALDIRGVRKDFAVLGGRVTALQDINLTVRQGEFISIIGSSGCGKSTLLRIIAGLETDYRGDAEFEGTRINGIPAPAFRWHGPESVHCPRPGKPAPGPLVG